MKTTLLTTFMLILSFVLASCGGESQPLLNNPRGSQTTSNTNTRHGDMGVNERSEVTEEEVDEDEVFYDSLGSRDRLTRSFTSMNLSDDVIRDMARRILELKDLKPGKYPISGNISLTLVMIKYMAELGDFEVGARDIGVILKGFGDLAGEKFSEPIWDVIRQIKKVRLGTQNGRAFVKLFTKSGGRLIYRVFEPMDGDILETVQMNNQDTIWLDPIDSMIEKNDIMKFLNAKETFLGFEIGKLNQIHPGIKPNMWYHLDRMDLSYPNLRISAASAFIKTRKRKVDLMNMYVFPGLEDGSGKPLPSVVIRGKTGMFKLKMSIDQ